MGSGVEFGVGWGVIVALSVTVDSLFALVDADIRDAGRVVKALELDPAAVTPSGRPSSPRGPSTAAGSVSSSSTRRRVGLGNRLAAVHQMHRDAPGREDGSDISGKPEVIRHFDPFPPRRGSARQPRSAII